ncbi:MAG: methyltransferase domain-containing protein [Planctomycetota bacterium]|nr:methyltransferase domain-containing protein [Planctomycetota bacterium]MDA1105823.1 methyltransferase domain-containing protein [Planctomycetota bacterium]
MLNFLRHALTNFKGTGAIAPSSPALAERMVAPLAAMNGHRTILEVGPGTGPFTKVILRHLRTGDALDICEFNEGFCDHLERGVMERHRTAGRHGSVRLLRGDIRTVGLAGSYDVIVCGLPFTNFPTPMVHDIFERLLGVLRPGGVMTFFRYYLVRGVQAPFVGRPKRARLRALSELESALGLMHALRTEVVLANVPPAVCVTVVRSTDHTASISPWRD